jgi:uncharacterized protein YukE
MSGGYWTLLGFGVAAVFSFASSWFLQSRRTWLEWRKERDDELRAARVAALMISDELDTHAMNYKQLHDLGRTPVRPLAPNVLSSKEWEEHKVALARVTSVPIETWDGLTHAYHNAQQLRWRIEVDGPNVPFPPHRIRNLEDHAEASEELAEILSDAAKTISRAARPRRRRGIRGMWTTRGLPPRP